LIKTLIRIKIKVKIKRKRKRKIRIKRKSKILCDYCLRLLFMIIVYDYCL